VISNGNFSPDDGLDLVALSRAAWRYKYEIGATVTICVIAALFIAFTATSIYRAEVVITPANNTAMGGGGAPLASQLGGLATLAGMNFAAGNPDREAAAVLESRQLVDEFIKRNNLVRQLLPDVKGESALWFATQRFRGNVLTIRKDMAKGTTTVAIEWTDPQTAARWANAFVALANDLVRFRALEDSKRNVAYLNDQIARTNLVDLKRVMYSLVEMETKTLMLANGKQEYAFTVVDPAVSPEIRSSPRRTIIVLLGVVFGIVIGCVVAYLRNALTQFRGQSTGR
jgi:uncharacterized protein involved in exopolysaccharide biosynthesis